MLWRSISLPLVAICIFVVMRQLWVINKVVSLVSWMWCNYEEVHATQVKFRAPLLIRMVLLACHRLFYKNNNRIIVTPASNCSYIAISLQVTSSNQLIIPGGDTCPMQPEHEAVEGSHQFPTIRICTFNLNYPGSLLPTLNVTVKALGDHLAVRR